MPRFYIQLLLWSAICILSAAPSYVMALQEYSRPDHHLAMWAAVCFFIAAYTLIGSTDWAHRFRQLPFVRDTMFFGYGTRIAISIFALPVPFLIFPDVWFGAMSIGFVTDIVGLQDRSVAMVFTTTIVEGLIWNIVLLMYMLFLYGMQLSFRKMPTPKNVCINCGYDLRASGEICPECGTPRRNGAEELKRAETA